jgi:hypothetical protein
MKYALGVCTYNSPASLLDVSVDNCQNALVDKSGMIRNHVGDLK